MIMPTKYITEDKALLGAGALVLSELQIESHTVTSLWEKLRGVPGIVSFQRFCLILSMLYAIGALDFQDGIVRRTENAS